MDSQRDEKLLLKQRLDEFVNAVAGMGDPSRDKATHTAFVADATLSRKQLNGLYKSSWLSKRLVNLTANDAVKNWWRLEDADQDAIVQAQIKDLNLRQKLVQALSWANLYGESAILINEGRASAAPIDNLRQIESLQVVAGGCESPELVTVRDSNMNLIAFVYYPLAEDQNPIEYHPSRVLFFQQEQMPRELLDDNGGCAYSALQVVWNAIRRYGVAMQSGEQYAWERSFLHISLRHIANSAGLSNVVDSFEATMRRMMLAKGIYRAMVTGKDDTIQAFDMNFSGWSDYITGLMYEVAGAYDAPVTRIFGMSPAGMNATGEMDQENYISRLESKEQESILRAPLEQLVRAIMTQALGPFGGNIQQFDLIFNPIRINSAEEDEQLEVSKSNRLLASVREGVLMTSEARPALFPDGNNDGVVLDDATFAAESERAESFNDLLMQPTEADDADTQTSGA